MKPSVGKLKNSRGRIVGYVASIGPVQTESYAMTPTEASTACERETLAALERLDRGTRVFQWQGHTVVVAPTVHGWSYWFDTLSRTDLANHVGAPTREDAENAALHHLAQHVWEPVFDDADFLATLPPSVARDISRWIHFQREYTRIRAEGKSDVEAHREAHS